MFYKKYKMLSIMYYFTTTNATTSMPSLNIQTSEVHVWYHSLYNLRVLLQSLF